MKSGSPRLPPRPSALRSPAVRAGPPGGAGTPGWTRTRARVTSRSSGPSSARRAAACRPAGRRASSRASELRRCCACGSSGDAACGAGGVMAWGRGAGARARRALMSASLLTSHRRRYRGIRASEPPRLGALAPARHGPRDEYRENEDDRGRRPAEREAQESHGGDAAHQTAAADVSVACGQPGQVVYVDAVEEVSENRRENVQRSPPLVGQLGVSVFGHVARPRCSPALICRTLPPPLDLRRLWPARTVARLRSRAPRSGSRWRSDDAPSLGLAAHRTTP